MATLLLEIFRGFTNIAGDDFQPNLRLAYTRHTVEPQNFVPKFKSWCVVRAIGLYLREAEHIPIESYRALILVSRDFQGYVRAWLKFQIHAIAPLYGNT